MPSASAFSRLLEVSRLLGTLQRKTRDFHGVAQVKYEIRKERRVQAKSEFTDLMEQTLIKLGFKR